MTTTSPRGIEFTNLNSLFGAVMVTGERLSPNDPATDPRGADGQAATHPGRVSRFADPLWREAAGMVAFPTGPAE